MQGKWERSFDAPRTLGPTAEGTPNIYEVKMSEGIEDSTIDVGFHYFREAKVDRQARGRLKNLSRWTAEVEPSLNEALERRGVRGNIGDRDHGRFRGVPFDLVEGQIHRGDRSSWRVYLYVRDSREVLPIHPRTHKGSVAFANPTFSHVKSPRGVQAIAVTCFIPEEGAAPGEGGELIFYREM